MTSFLPLTQLFGRGLLGRTLSPLRQIFLEASQGAIGAYRPNGYGVDAEGCVILLRAHDGPAIHARQLLEHLSERVASEKCPLAKRLTQVRLTANRPCLD